MYKGKNKLFEKIQISNKNGRKGNFFRIVNNEKIPNFIFWCKNGDIYKSKKTYMKMKYSRKKLNVTI